MSQSAALRALDADIAAAFLDAGMADTATYTPPGGGIALPCTVMIDVAVQYYGEGHGQVVGTRDLVTLFLADVPNPLRGGTVVADGKVYKLDDEDARDQSMSRWVVIDG